MKVSWKVVTTKAIHQRRKSPNQLVNPPIPSPPQRTGRQSKANYNEQHATMAQKCSFFFLFLASYSISLIPWQPMQCQCEPQRVPTYAPQPITAQQLNSRDTIQFTYKRESLFDFT